MDNDVVILIVDDNKGHADALAEELTRHYGNVFTASSAQQACRIMQAQDVDLVLCGLEPFSDQGPAGSGRVSSDGLDLPDLISLQYPDTVVVITTANPTIESCKAAMRKGAHDYLAKPVESAHIRSLISTLIRQKSKSRTDQDFVFEGIVARSTAMQKVFHIARRVSPTNISVLIEGESGTGKELTAKAIHDNSQRKKKPFCPLNCAGLTESLLESELFGHTKGAFTGAIIDRKGLFEMADGGTLFLDEIGDMPITMQAKLLRVLEDGIVRPVGSTRHIVVDVRVISATNHDLAMLAEQKKFRQDLYFRIKGVSITLPPLRSRPEDIPELFGYFLKQSCDELGRDIHRITESAMAILMGYRWPGNIRQLRHAIRTMVVMCDSDIIDVNDIPLDIHRVKRLPGQTTDADHSPQTMVGQSLEEVEKQHIANTLRMTKDNRAEAARILKIGERTLYRKIKEYNL